MARFLGCDELGGRESLRTAGVQVLRAIDSDGAVDPAILELVLEPAARAVRAVMTAEPASAGSEDSGMGSWHVNGADEVHSVLDGQGLMEFWTQQGAVCILVEAGDVLVIQGAEHRYRPLTDQRWAIRYSGGPDADLVGTNTGRPAEPWREA
jgi:mannose-6-phosphate isomerase-like protein (cupin superfamily)